MSQYTTGEMAKLCEVSVRTVQFYDKKDLLHPSELTEGGRRLYSEADLEKLKLICVLKSLGLSLDAIKGIFASEAPNKVLLLLLEEQTKAVDESLAEMEKQKKAIDAVSQSLRQGEILSVNSLGDIDALMEGKKKLKKAYRIMLIGGVLLDLAEIAALLLWILKGQWQPFALLMPMVVVICWFLVKLYYRNAAYLCPECGKKFKPRQREFFFARHTRKARRLTCTDCGHKGWCVETYAEEEKQ